MNSTKQEYTTHDLDLAATLLTCGVSLIDITRASERRASFVFDDVKRCEDLRREYVRGELRTNALQLLRNLRELKYRVHQV